ncbi:hypothetical protein COLO4_35163 [Corchorus olitorius]|uniref:Uncharacterized protein n=1 Tax=Corchorus olitorius TaxID=93759 RepID=A0A1R3GI22_9ROSI|nr:hypothetical protein COLO4_35163 [Corchorus olitorius]
MARKSKAHFKRRLVKKENPCITPNVEDPVLLIWQAKLISGSPSQAKHTSFGFGMCDALFYAATPILSYTPQYRREFRLSLPIILFNPTTALMSRSCCHSTSTYPTLNYNRTGNFTIALTATIVITTRPSTLINLPNFITLIIITLTHLFF